MQGMVGRPDLFRSHRDQSTLVGLSSHTGLLMCPLRRPCGGRGLHPIREDFCEAGPLNISPHLVLGKDFRRVRRTDILQPRLVSQPRIENLDTNLAGDMLSPGSCA